MSNIAFREATEDDMRFIVPAWIRSYRHSEYSGPIPVEMYDEAYSGFIDKTLGRDTVVCMVGYNPNEEDTEHQIYGFAVVEDGQEFTTKEGKKLIEDGEPVVHYVYVKQPFRKLGVARAILKKLGVSMDNRFSYTYSTRMVKLLKRHKKMPLSRFDPNIARFPRKCANKETKCA